MNGMDQERFEDLKEAYVLGALPEEERVEFERYLSTNPNLQPEVEELGAFADLLALSPEQQEPAPELRRRIMDTVQAEAVQAEAVQTQGHPRAESRSWLDRLWDALGLRDLALAGAAVLVVGLFSWGMLLQGEVNDLQGRVQGLQGQVQDQSQAPQMIALGGAGTEQGARAELVTLEGDRAVLVVEDMPPVPEGKTYQIWVIKGDTPQPSGLFEPKGGSIAAVVEKPVEGADAVAVTVEPEGGSPKPTTDPMLVGEVKA
jgi:anti-sigma-K factor RskA